MLSSKASLITWPQIFPPHYLIFTRLMISLSTGPCARLPCIVHSQVVSQIQEKNESGHPSRSQGGGRLKMGVSIFLLQQLKAGPT